MRRNAGFAPLLAAAACLALAPWTDAPAQELYLAPDVATSPDGVTTLLPWEIARLDVGAYSIVAQLGGAAGIDALHKLDAPGEWLISFDAPRTIVGSLQASPEDVVRLGAGDPALFFDGSCVVGAVAPQVNLNAVTLTAGDDGNLLAALGVAADLGTGLVRPSAVVEYTRTGAGACDWSLVGVHTDLTAAPSTAYTPGSARITGLDEAGGLLMIAFDIPVDLGPTTETVPFLPGQVVVYDSLAGEFGTLLDLRTIGVPGWPVSSEIDALSCEANPGRLPEAAGITMTRAGGDVVIHCAGSCSSGGRSYGIYEGALDQLRAGSYDHVQRSCSSDCPGSSTLTPAAGDAYYLVVPHNATAEGSYGTDSSLGERPPAPVACAPVRIVTPCP
ncbi:MAG: hypothetical protein PVH00_13510 [Gemmatimonadota bacterium]|jgi:hypothetical protein